MTNQKISFFFIYNKKIVTHSSNQLIFQLKIISSFDSKYIFAILNVKK